MIKAKKVKFSPEGNHEDVKATVFDKKESKEVNVTITKDFDDRVWSLMQEGYKVLAAKSERKGKNLMPKYIWVEVKEEAPELQKQGRARAKKEQAEK